MLTWMEEQEREGHSHREEQDKANIQFVETLHDAEPDVGGQEGE